MRQNKQTANISWKLKLLLKFVNLVPPNEQLPDANELFEKNFFAKTGINLHDPDLRYTKDYFHYRPISISETVMTIKIELEKYPGLFETIDDIYRQLTGSKDDYGVDRIQFSSYVAFLEIRERLRIIAGMLDRRLYKKPPSGQMWLMDFKFESEVSILDGLFKFTNDVIVDALQNVDADRLRICMMCSRIFWAHRRDKFGCSKKCNQNIRAYRNRAKAARPPALNRNDLSGTD